MKQLIRRLSRVADSSQYYLLRSETRTQTRSTHRSNSVRKSKDRRSRGVPVGHLPVYVGEEMERFIVSADLLNHPIFIELLKKSAQEYGYEQKGVLRIPCRVFEFERVLQVLQFGDDEASDLEELLQQLSQEFL